MVDPVTARRWSYRALFVALAAGIVFVQVLPFRFAAGAVPGPDWLLLLALSWAARRPDYLPPLLLGAVLLVADLLFMRPLGLMAAMGVLSAEYLRSRAMMHRDMSFALEWMLAATAITGAILGAAALKAVTLLDQPPLTATAIYLAVNVAAYPLAAGFSALVCGVRRAAPGQVDALGHRL